MTTRITPTNDDALANFIARKAEIDALLTQLQDASANHFEVSPDNIHWGHVGSLTFSAEKLREIAAFLNVRRAPSNPTLILPRLVGLGVVAGA